MILNVERVDVWAATVDDRPGGLAKRLEILAKAGANLAFVIARRVHERPGTGVVFVTPLSGDVQLRAAREAGFIRTESVHSLRVEGPDQPGLSFLACRALASAEIDLRGFSAATQGNRFVMYLAFDSAAERDRAQQRLAAPL